MSRPFKTPEEMMVEAESFQKVFSIFCEEIKRLEVVYGRELSLEERGRTADYAVSKLKLPKDRKHTLDAIFDTYLGAWFISGRPAADEWARQSFGV